MSKCECNLCIENRKITATINGMIPEYRPFVEGLLDRALNAEFDNDYYQAILSGKWPSSVEILEKALEKAKEMQEKLNDPLYFSVKKD